MPLIWLLLQTLLCHPPITQIFYSFYLFLCLKTVFPKFTSLAQVVPGPVYLTTMLHANILEIQFQIPVLHAGILLWKWGKVIASFLLCLHQARINPLCVAAMTRTFIRECSFYAQHQAGNHAFSRVVHHSFHSYSFIRTVLIQCSAESVIFMLSL